MKLKQLGKNKTELELKNGNTVYFSYGVPVVALVPGRGWLRTAKYPSNTTSNHIGEFLSGGETATTVLQSELDTLADGGN